MKIKKIIIDICEACLNGEEEGEQCNTAGCALWLHLIDYPFDKKVYQVVSEYEVKDENVDGDYIEGSFKEYMIEGSFKEYMKVTKLPVKLSDKFEKANKKNIYIGNEVWGLRNEKLYNIIIKEIKSNNFVVSEDNWIFLIEDLYIEK